MTFEERKEINRILKGLPKETRLTLDRMGRWRDMAIEESMVGADFCVDPDDPRDHTCAENGFYAERRVLQLFDKLVECGALRALVDLAYIAEQAQEARE